MTRTGSGIAAAAANTRQKQDRQGCRRAYTPAHAHEYINPCAHIHAHACAETHVHENMWHIRVHRLVRAVHLSGTSVKPQQQL